MAWMTAEAAVAITAGILASSLALTGFGLDSVLELWWADPAAALAIAVLAAREGLEAWHDD